MIVFLCLLMDYIFSRLNWFYATGNTIITKFKKLQNVFTINQFNHFRQPLSPSLMYCLYRYDSVLRTGIVAFLVVIIS